jgi:hypothetical protein
VRLTYIGERLREIAFPLGGIGTGTISLGGRGNLQDFGIANRPATGRPPLRGFFATGVDDGSGAPNARVLERQLFPPFTGFRRHTFRRGDQVHNFMRAYVMNEERAVPLDGPLVATAGQPLTLSISSSKPTTGAA